MWFLKYSHTLPTFFPLYIIGVRPKAKLSIEELLRQQAAKYHHHHGNSRGSRGHAVSKTTPKKIKSKAITSKTVQWPVLPQVQIRTLVSPVAGRKTQGGSHGELLKEKPISRKATPTHEEVIRNRDLVFEVSCSPFVDVTVGVMEA